MFRNIYSFLADETPPDGCNIIKKRHDNLNEQGDACFPLDVTVWKKFQKKNSSGDQIDFDHQELVKQSQSWSTPIERVSIEGLSCRLFFKRTACLKVYFQSVQGSDKLPPLTSNEDLPEGLDLNSFRQRIVKEAQQRLLFIYTLHKGQQIESPSSAKIGSCFDVQTKKPFPLSYAQYLTKRSTDMQLIAQHKYGLRVQNEKYLRDLVNTLGSAAVTVDLLEAKTSGPVFLASSSCRVTNSSSKGASFILYNSARIETLFRVYEERLRSGYYPDPPGSFDWSLLNQEDEWKLFYNFLVEYDEVLERTVQGAEIQIHHLCAFVYKLVGQFSAYYRRTKILTENRSHLLPVLYVRLEFLKEIRRVLNELLYILGISPVQQM